MLPRGFQSQPNWWIMQKLNGKTQGHMLQFELVAWYQDTLKLPERALNVERADEQLCHAAAVRLRVRQLVKAGWSLQMSEDESPADKAGIDFIWQHRRRGWFALDAKAVSNTRCCLIRLVEVSNSTEVGEFRKLRFEDKVRFFEQLIELAEGPAPELNLQDCPPPVMETVRDSTKMLEELRSFRDRLATMGKRPGCAHCTDWQAAINRAMGFVTGCKRQRNNPEQVALVQQRVAEIINAYIKSVLAEKPPRGFGSPFEARFRRNDKLLYTVHLDQVKLPVDAANVVTVAGIAAYARKAFQKRHQELVAKHGAAEWLLMRRRTFEAQGVERTINHLLDVLDRDPFRA